MRTRGTATSSRSSRRGLKKLGPEMKKIKNKIRKTRKFQPTRLLPDQLWETGRNRWTPWQRLDYPGGYIVSNYVIFFLLIFRKNIDSPSCSTVHKLELVSNLLMRLHPRRPGPASPGQACTGSVPRSPTARTGPDWSTANWLASLASGQGGDSPEDHDGYLLRFVLLSGWAAQVNALCHTSSN